MSDLTFGDARVPAAGTAASGVPRKSWFARILDAMIEARMAQVRRDIRMRLPLRIHTLDEQGNSEVK